MWVRVKKSFPTQNVMDKWKGHSVLVGNRSYTHADGPIEVSNGKAKELFKAGVAEVCDHPPIEDAQKAVAPKLEHARR